MQKKILEFLKLIAFRYLRIGKPNYPYLLDPSQLAQLIVEFERLKSQAGSIVEIGVARGMTTRFLAEHIMVEKLENKESIYALDIFSNFQKEDVNFEIENRGKNSSDLNAYGYNDFNIWKKNFLDFPFVKAIQADCSTFDYNTIGPIKMSFLDVNLYLPTKKALPKIYEATISGGVILVDDVIDEGWMDGSCQAYKEFCSDLGVEPIIIGKRCGAIYKP